MTVLVAEAHAHVQKLVSVVKMVTVFAGCTTEEQRSVVCFPWTKGLNAKDIQKEKFSDYGWKCLSRNAFSEGRSEVADDDRAGAKVAETTVERLLCCGFRCNGKEMGQVYQCWWRC
jgi:hypothetical protein